MQYLYEGHSFDSPFLLTYIGVSLFALWIPTHHVCSGSDDVPDDNESSYRPVSPSEEEGAVDADGRWGRKQHFRTAMFIAPVWFLGTSGRFDIARRVSDA